MACSLKTVLDCGGIPPKARPKIKRRIVTLKPAHLQWSEDGRLVSLDYDDVYFQPGQGIEESRYVFLQHNNLPARFAAGAAKHFRICELGFGTGLNFLLTAQLFLQAAPPDALLTYVSIEKHPIDLVTLEKLHGYWPELADLSAALRAGYPPLIAGFHTVYVAKGRVRLILAFGDAAEVLPQISGPFDAWYLDGFSPKKNPAMWEEAFFPRIAAQTVAGGTLSSFSVIGRMRRALAAVGFDVQKVAGYGIKHSMTVARMPENDAAPAATQNKKIIVIGAGIAGCSVAHSLARRGENVLLLDKHPASAMETSGNPLAVVYPKMTVDRTPMGSLYQNGFCYTRTLMRDMRLDDFIPCGVLHMDTDHDTAARHAEIITRNGYPADYAVHKNGEGLFQPLAGFVPPAKLCAALAAHARITFQQANVLRLTRADNLWHIETGHGTETATHVVIAAGTQAAAFSQTQWLPLQSLRGQVTVVQSTTASKALAHVICHDGYMTPAVNGVHCIGATFQKEPAGDATPRAADDAENIHKLQQNLPQFGISEKDIVSSRAGFRMTTRDKLPVIGRAPDAVKWRAAFAGLRKGPVPDDIEKPYIDGLYIAAGFGAHGMTTAPLAGEIIAADICGTPLPCPADLAVCLKPERFILRDLKRGKI